MFNKKGLKKIDKDESPLPTTKEVIHRFKLCNVYGEITVV